MIYTLVSILFICFNRNFILAYLARPKESGKVHNNVKERFLKGDQVVIKAMQQFANYAEKAKAALESKDQALLASLMNQNFDTRRTLYGDDVIGAENLKMIHIARGHGFAAKFSGSGGCIILLWPDSSTPFDILNEKVNLLRRDMFKSHFVFLKCQI